MSAKKVDSPDVQPVQPKQIDGSFDTVYVAEPEEIVVASGVKGDSKGNAGLSALAQELAFNEEVVEVMLHETTDPCAENPVFTACNGVTQYFYRGIPQQVKRKYLAILASCKEHGISTPEYAAPDGSRAMGIRRTSSLKYPFSVISDPNPRGAAWLRDLLRSPT